MTSILLVPDLPIERWPSMDRYALRLIGGLEEAAPDLSISVATRVSRLTAEDGAARADEARKSARSYRATTAKEWRRYFSRYWTYPRRVKRKHSDVIHVLDHSYAHVLRARGSRPAVITVHDLLPVITLQRKEPSFRARVRDRLLEWVLSTLRQADRWIVATEWMRQQLGEWLGHNEQISVIPYGVDDAFFSHREQTRQEARDRWEIPDTAFLVLHVGTVGPRKNFGAVIATVAGLRSGGLDAWLLQVGDTMSPDQQTDINRRALGDVVRALGSTDESELRAAYRAADVLLFPSHYEGFGLPVLEGMASELPVVNSGAGGLTELSGDAAVIVGGREVEPYVEALARIADDEAWRNGLVQRGIERAKQFRWSETARMTADVYRRLVA